MSLTYRLTLSTPCPFTGMPCPAAVDLARSLGRALAEALPLCGPDLALSGTCSPSGCRPSCVLEWHAEAAAMQVVGALTGSGIPADPAHPPVNAAPPGPIVRAEAGPARVC